MKNTKKRDQPKVVVDAVRSEPSSEYSAFERTLKGLLAVPKSEVEALERKRKTRKTK
jgi:hypothetical protein